MANIIEAFNEVFTEEYALAKFFFYAIPVFICINAYLTGQFVLSYICVFFVTFLLLGLMTCGIHNLRENKQEILTFNIQEIIVSTFKVAIAMVPQFSIAGLIVFFVREFVQTGEESQLETIVNIIIYSILASFLMTSYLAFTKHLEIKEAYNLKIIFESVIDVFVNLVFLSIQFVIANSIFIGLMTYVFTVLNLPFTHPAFLFYCSIVVIVNISLLANLLSQASYDYIKGSDEDYKDRYKIGSTLVPAGASGGGTITSSANNSSFTPGGISTIRVNNMQAAPSSNNTSPSQNRMNTGNLGTNYGNKNNNLRNKSSSTLNNGSRLRNNISSRGQNSNLNKSISNNSTQNKQSSSNLGKKSSNNASQKRTFGNGKNSGGSGFGRNNKKNNGGGFNFNNNFKKK